MLIKKCADLLDGETTCEDTVVIPKLSFTEADHSVLRQMPWITVIEHKVSYNTRIIIIVLHSI